jgi:hypothetical protein
MAGNEFLTFSSKPKAHRNAPTGLTLKSPSALQPSSAMGLSSAGLYPGAIFF